MSLSPRAVQVVKNKQTYKHKSIENVNMSQNISRDLLTLWPLWKLFPHHLLYWSQHSGPLLGQSLQSIQRKLIDWINFSLGFQYKYILLITTFAHVYFWLHIGTVGAVSHCNILNIQCEYLTYCVREAGIRWTWLLMIIYVQFRMNVCTRLIKTNELNSAACHLYSLPWQMF